MNKIKFLFFVILVTSISNCSVDDECVECQFGVDYVSTCLDDFESKEAFQAYVKSFNCR